MKTSIAPEDELRILRKILKETLRQQSFSFADARRRTGNLGNQINEDPADLALILLPIAKELFNETFRLENFVSRKES